MVAIFLSAVAAVIGYNFEVSEPLLVAGVGFEGNTEAREIGLYAVSDITGTALQIDQASLSASSQVAAFSVLQEIGTYIVLTPPGTEEEEASYAVMWTGSAGTAYPFSDIFTITDGRSASGTSLAENYPGSTIVSTPAAGANLWYSWGGDGEFDGDVDGRDFLELQRFDRKSLLRDAWPLRYGTMDPPSNPAFSAGQPTPEPTTAAGALLLCWLMTSVTGRSRCLEN